ncbi:hypothetical protein A9G83_000705 [Salmonella enterica subsp. enterica serovar Sundsvall]|nr:hypothetical protein [Salmonella enterica subsp. enterica serovar Sundsvall]
MLCVVWRYQFPFSPSGTALFTQQKRASPGDGLITQPTRAQRQRAFSPLTCAQVLFSVVYGETYGGGSRLIKR